MKKHSHFPVIRRAGMHCISFVNKRTAFIVYGHYTGIMKITKSFHDFVNITF